MFNYYVTEDSVLPSERRVSLCSAGKHLLSSARIVLNVDKTKSLILKW